MNESEKLFKEYLAEVNEAYPEGEVTWRSTYGTDGYKGEITFKFSDFKEDQAVMVINRKVLCEETNVTVTLMIYADSSTGWSSVPVGGLLGERIGEMDLRWLIKNLPEELNHNAIASRYLAKNPDMLISQLSNVLNTQRYCIDKQEKLIQDVDWDLSRILENATGKCKSLLLMHDNYFERKEFSPMKHLRKVIGKLSGKE